MTKNPSIGTGFYSGGGHASRVSPPPMGTLNFRTRIDNPVPDSEEILEILKSILSNGATPPEMSWQVERKAGGRLYHWEAEITSVIPSERGGALEKALLPRVGVSNISLIPNDDGNLLLTINVNSNNFFGFNPANNFELN